MKKNLILILMTGFLVFAIFQKQAVSGNTNFADKIEGIWALDRGKTMQLRIEKGTPWHISDKYGMGRMDAIREFKGNKFQFYDAKSGEMVDRGYFKVYSSNGNEVTLRFFLEDNRFDVNNLKFEELLRFTAMAGDQVPYIIGLRFIDDNTVESFSYVRGFGEDKMDKKDDNACWERIEKIPNT